MPHAEGTPNRREITFRLPAIRPHVPIARSLVREELAGWGLKEDVKDSVLVIVTELVTNAVVHCRVSSAEFEVSVYEQDENLFVSVSDPGNHMPTPRKAGEEAENGRGLELVSMLAADWSTAPRKPVGKTVTARIVTTEMVEA
jgi:anti-sigma regulatory factor (Ser/Thr protein kinase)